MINIDGILSKIFRKSVNIEYIDGLYLSDALNEKKLPKIKKKIEEGKGSVCLLLKSSNNEDCLDIVTPMQLKMKVWEGKNPVCVGLANGKEDAAALVETIIKDCMDKTGGTGLKEFICSL